MFRKISVAALLCMALSGTALVIAQKVAKDLDDAHCGKLSELRCFLSRTRTATQIIARSFMPGFLGGVPTYLISSSARR
jgi:hypothetical protein